MRQVTMEQRMNRRQISFGTNLELAEKDRTYWNTAGNEEKFETITYLRECFYGPEATTGRLQRIYRFFKQK
jgi:hypothetical protein